MRFLFAFYGFVVLCLFLVSGIAEEGSCAWEEGSTSCTGGQPDRSGIIWKGPGYEGRFSDSLVTGKVKRMKWNPRWAFADTIAPDNEPVILTNTMVKKWAALKKWTPEYLANLRDLEVMTGVKVSTDPTFFDLDMSSEMCDTNTTDPFVDFDYQVPYKKKSLSAEYFFDMVEEEDEEEMYYWFGHANQMERVKRDLEPMDLLWMDPKDEEICYLTLWLSTRGPRQHTHFDSDHNVFVQISGTKRFVLFSPDQQDEMYIYPRIHPMWHKSQVDYDNPDLDAFPNYRNATAVEAVLKPGEVLYVPPYWWHHVESVTPSVSLASWSKGQVYKEMSYAYEVEMPVHLQKTEEAKKAALYAQTVLLIERVYGEGATPAFIKKMVDIRFVSVKRHFSTPDDHDLCAFDRSPAFVDSVRDSMKRQIDNMGRHFDRLQGPYKDINVADYIELSISWSIGAHNVLPFLQDCFDSPQE